MDETRLPWIAGWTQNRAQTLWMDETRLCLDSRMDIEQCTATLAWAVTHSQAEAVRKQACTRPQLPPGIFKPVQPVVVWVCQEMHKADLYWCFQRGGECFVREMEQDCGVLRYEVIQILPKHRESHEGWKQILVSQETWVELCTTQTPGIPLEKLPQCFCEEENG